MRGCRIRRAAAPVASALFQPAVLWLDLQGSPPGTPSWVEMGGLL